MKQGAAAPMLSELRAITTGDDAVSEAEESASGANTAKASNPLATPQSEHPGEGIGLSIVKQLCELLDASLEFDSEPGKGSLFRVIFPLHYEAGDSRSQ